MYYISLKICYDSLLDNIFESVSDTACCDVVYDFYRKKWERMYYVLSAEYNPLENYNMTEKMTDYENAPGNEISYENFHEKTSGSTATGTTQKAGKDITLVSVSAQSVTVTETTTENPSTENAVTSMDDTENAKLHDKQTVSGDNAQKVLSSGYTDTERTGTQKTENVSTGITADATTNMLNINSDVTKLNSHLGERTGNIGVTTTQQMLEQELKISFMDKLMHIIVSDVCDFFSGGVYDDCNTV